jgi:hypothetical protein
MTGLPAITFGLTSILSSNFSFSIPFHLSSLNFNPRIVRSARYLAMLSGALLIKMGHSGRT